MSALPVALMSLDQYRVWEAGQRERHEYWRGEVFAQAGGTRRHSLLSTNLLAEFRNALRGRSCEAHGSDLRVYLRETGYQAYPDLTVVCPPIDSDHECEVSNPTVIGEVLSPSTADFDRGTKFDHYRSASSLREYILIWQDQYRLDQYTRTDAGVWEMRETTGLDAMIDISCLGIEFAMKDLYDRVVVSNLNK